MPFSSDPAEWQFFESESSSEVIPKLLHPLRSAAGVAVLTGPDGVGKTVLCKHLQATLARQGQAIVLPGTSLQTTDDLYLCIRRSLKTLDGQPVTTGSSRWEIVERLQSSTEFWGPIGLLVDDAHLLPAELFTELWFLMEQRSSSQSLCRVLLAGSHALEETLAQPAMFGFAQRIRTYAFLQPLRRKEAVEYLDSRLRDVGKSLTACFNSDAVEAVVEAADGSPRCLNLLADEALLHAFRNQEHRVTLDTVHLALTDLQHLPHSWNLPAGELSESAPDDASSAQHTWESSSDGVIEIGAPPVAVDAEPADHGIQQSPVVDDALQPAEESAVDEGDDLPILDDTPSDPWFEDVSLSEPLAPLEDDRDDEPAAIDEGDAFDAGDLLADLEEVGDPAVEIDADLDQRLLQVADAAESESPDHGQPSRTTADILPGMDRWQPAGCWELAETLVREDAQQRAAIVHPPQPLPSASAAADPAATQVQLYEIRIPAWDDPPPVWPPETSAFGAVRPIPLTVSPASTVSDLAPDTAADHHNAPSQVASDHPADDEQTEPIDHAREWSDGQLLHDLAATDICASEQIAVNSAAPESSDAVLLRIAGIDEDSQDAPPPVEDKAEERVSVRDQMFTLPIALNEVSGDCAPLAESVRELQQELDSFQKAADDSRLPTRGPAPAAVPPGSSDPDGPALAESQIDITGEDQSVDADPVESQLSLRRPQLVSQARQLLATAAPAPQLRHAAGAENSVFVEPVTPPLSVIPADECSTESSDHSAGADQESIGFRNLFTRLRKRQQSG